MPPTRGWFSTQLEDALKKTSFARRVGVARLVEPLESRLLFDGLQFHTGWYFMNENVKTSSGTEAANAFVYLAAGNNNAKVDKIIIPNSPFIAGSADPIVNTVGYSSTFRAPIDDFATGSYYTGFPLVWTLGTVFTIATTDDVQPVFRAKGNLAQFTNATSTANGLDNGPAEIDQIPGGPYNEILSSNDAGYFSRGSVYQHPESAEVITYAGFDSNVTYAMQMWAMNGLPYGGQLTVAFTEPPPPGPAALTGALTVAPSRISILTGPGVVKGSMRVTDTGTGPATGKLYADYYLSTNATFDAGSDTLLESHKLVTSLNLSANSAVTVPVQLALKKDLGAKFGTTEGSYYLIARLDPDKVITSKVSTVVSNSFGLTCNAKPPKAAALYEDAVAYAQAHPGFAKTAYSITAAENYIAGFEGFRADAYRDTKSLPTIGYGFNLTRPDAASVLAAFKLDLKEELTPFKHVGNKWTGPTGPIISKPMEQSDALKLLAQTVTQADTDARSLVPNFGALSSGAKFALVDLVFNVGKAKTQGFKKLLADLKAGDIVCAAYELMNSARATQVQPPTKSHPDGTDPNGRAEQDFRNMVSGNESELISYQTTTAIGGLH